MSWENCKNILVVRADNMGDLIMSTPAIRALKLTFGAKITVLTSSMAKKIASLIPEIDEILVYDIPWVKSSEGGTPVSFIEISELLKAKAFDAAVIFTVCSQNPLPAAMLIYMAGIPKILAYCRENPYKLITDWVPDKEPYSTISHQVRRDLELVKHIGADTLDETLSLISSEESWITAKKKLLTHGIDPSLPYLVFHPGVSETKREYTEDKWVELVDKCSERFRFPVLLTGARSEKQLTDSIFKRSKGACSLAGEFSLEEFIALLKNSQLVVSVNTGTIHIAAAVQTPVIVLYALTNPQHLPWMCKGKAFYFNVPENKQSKNEVIRFMHDSLMKEAEKEIQTEELLSEIQKIVNGNAEYFPELIPLK